MSKFIQPVSMRVTEEQYLRDLREPLLAMGYREERISGFSHCPIINNNYASKMGVVSNTGGICKEDFNRHFIPEYNPEYFLAVASMTNEELGIVGEWWECIENSSDQFTLNKLYKCETFSCGTPDFINEDGDLNGYYCRGSHLLNTKKATLSDLINHFECKIDNNKETMELTQQEKDTLVKLITKDNEAIFEKIGVTRDKNPIRFADTGYRENNENQVINQLITMIEVANVIADTIGKPELKGRSFVLRKKERDQYKFVLHEKDGLQVLAIEEK